MSKTGFKSIFQALQLYLFDINPATNYVIPRNCIGIFDRPQRSVEPQSSKCHDFIGFPPSREWPEDNEKKLYLTAGLITWISWAPIERHRPMLRQLILSSPTHFTAVLPSCLYVQTVHRK